MARHQPASPAPSTSSEHAARTSAAPTEAALAETDTGAPRLLPASLYSSADLRVLQRGIGNQGVQRLLAHSLADVPARSPRDTGAAPLLQRMIAVKLVDDLIKAADNGHRPPGPLSKGAQGDHTTPYLTLSHQVLNAIQDLSPENAWKNLIATHEVYTTLPGYALSQKWLIEQSDKILESNRKISASDVTAKNVEAYANDLLTIRNRLKYTALPTKGGSTGNNNEQGTAGALQWAELQVRGGKKLKYDQNDVIITMWKSFDGVRFQDIEDKSHRQNVLNQHILTVLDAYPTLTEEFKITKELLKSNSPYKP